MSQTPHTTPMISEPPGADHAPSRRGVLARMRIRKKMVVLHTFFSLSMTCILLVALRPTLLRVVAEAEQQEALDALELVMRDSLKDVATEGEVVVAQAGDVRVRRGVDPRSVPPEWVQRARAAHGTPVAFDVRDAPGTAAAWVGANGSGQFWLAESSLASARRAVLWVYGYTIAALLVVYALIAGALELFILPQHVYQPIAIMLRADRALREGRRSEELVPEADMPADEIGEIMRSRNASIQTMRQHEAALADALDRVELAAGDLKRKNHLLETARRNLADADRLVSLGMMAAGIAHELNTPLAVAKGLTEKLEFDPAAGLSKTEAALLRRVVGRIERLSESLLDFARVRPPTTVSTDLSEVVADAMTLMRLDRGTAGVFVTNSVPPGFMIQADPDRLVQVLVNLIRNAMDAMASGPRATGTGNGLPNNAGRIEIAASRFERDGAEWVSLTVTDDGPGIDPEVLPHLFEPFVSRRLDDRGTGLGLAVSEGIVREHGGTIIAANRSGRTGAVFEVMLPAISPDHPSV